MNQKTKKAIEILYKKLKGNKRINPDLTKKDVEDFIYYLLRSE